MEMLMRATDILKSIKETRFSGLRPPSEFFDVTRISRPADMNQATSRISYNTRYFSGNYGAIVLALSVYSFITDPFLLFALAFLVFGFIGINKYAPDATQIGDHTVTQKHLYTGLFVIGIPMLWIANPFGFLFWLVGASSILILGHACLLEPGVESDYASIQETV